MAADVGGPEVDNDKARDVLAAARELFGQVGYAKAGVREIARRANVAVGTVYAHFPSGKVDVLEAVMSDRMRSLVAHVLGSPLEDPVERFLDATRRLNSELVRDPLLRKLRSEQGRIPEPRLRERGRQIEDRFHAIAVDRLREMDAAGLIHCPDPEAVATLLRVTTRGWLQARDDGRDLVEHDRMLEMLLDGVRALINSGGRAAAPADRGR
ncbi:TetR/AcrR family transcriptional regulator [Pseudonocardia acaciae]|uniref:TetR/AcrR family transcriptional regulator n=1 Tax=Pseudonocardia acaciae TaxID=551276 RepID=UPI001B80E417|nr:TetR/AcrR family transcriptional regulator [Pseudonocardia acaciae]